MDRIVNISFGLLIALYMVYVAATAELSTQNIEYSALQDQIHAEHVKKLLLNEQYLDITALSTIDRKERAAGMVDAKVIYLR